MCYNNLLLDTSTKLQQIFIKNRNSSLIFVAWGFCLNKYIRIMNKITATCADALSPVTAYACGGLKGNRIQTLLIGRSDMAAPASGDVLTYAEAQIALALPASGTENLIALTHISNGLIDETGSSELTDLDTESGLPEKFNVMMSITGNIKHPTENVYLQTMAYNINPKLRVWAIDNKGYIWGGTTGYLCSGMNAFSPKKMDGTVQMVSFNLSYIADDVSDVSLQDDDFLTIDNP